MLVICTPGVSAFLYLEIQCVLRHGHCAFPPWLIVHGHAIYARLMCTRCVIEVPARLLIRKCTHIINLICTRTLCALDVHAYTLCTLCTWCTHANPCGPHAHVHCALRALYVRALRAVAARGCCTRAYSVHSMYPTHVVRLMCNAHDVHSMCTGTWYGGCGRARPASDMHTHTLRWSSTICVVDVHA